MNEFNLEYNVIVEGKIELISATIISSGEKGSVDQLFIRDYLGKPIIPGTSITGVLRSVSKKLFESNGLQDKFNKFWGYVETQSDENANDALISQIYVNDATLDGDTKIEVRNSVTIDRTRHTSTNQKLFDYETMIPGSKFNFSMEFRQVKYDEELVEMFQSLVKVLESGLISLGAKTNNGLGRIKLIDTKVNSYDLRDIVDIKKWLTNKSNTREVSGLDISVIDSDDLEINAEFTLVSSLLIKTYNSHPDDVDSTHFKVGGKPYIPGSSIKGVIRARMERISETLNIDANVENLFGSAIENNSHVGNIKFNEIELKKVVETKQTRIKIDKFTGSTIKGALFASNVIWNVQRGNTNINLEIVIKNYAEYKKYAAILLLALKDLWDEDLAVGSEQSIGRGRFIGKSLQLKLGDGSVNYTDNGLAGDKWIIEEIEASLKEVLK